MQMTFEQYIHNPAGKNASVMNAVARDAFKKSYTSKFGMLMLRENGVINTFLYYDKKHNAYYAHIKIPSETVKKFYYDVVIKFTATQNVEAAGKDLFKWNVQFYSNDPAFCYTYAYAFNKNDLFIKELSKRMIKKCLTDKPKQKNPTESSGYVKTIYFAYLYMQSKKLNSVDKFSETAMNFTLGHLIGNIEDAATKVKSRQDRIPDEDEPKKKEPPKEDTIGRIKKEDKPKLGLMHNVGKIKPKEKISRSSKGIGHFNSNTRKK